MDVGGEVVSIVVDLTSASTGVNTLKWSVLVAVADQGIAVGAGVGGCWGSMGKV